MGSISLGDPFSYTGSSSPLTRSPGEELLEAGEGLEHLVELPRQRLLGHLHLGPR